MEEDLIMVGRHLILILVVGALTIFWGVFLDLVGEEHDDPDEVQIIRLM